MTPAVLAARCAEVEVSIHEYSHDPKAESYGGEAADKLGVAPETIFKTLVVQTENMELMVCIIPVLTTLDLKAAANALRVKKLQMADKSLVERTTGYVIGGVSPLGQKKKLATLLDFSAQPHERIYVSGGRRGLDIALSPTDLIKLCDAQLASVARNQ